MACGTLAFQLANSSHCQDQCLWRRNAEKERGERVHRKDRPDEERPVELKSHLRDWCSSAGSECSTTGGQEKVKESLILQL